MFINTNANLKIIMEETLSAQPIVLATTLGDWLEYWLETYIRPTAKPSAYEHYADNCRKHIIPVIGDLPLDSITTAILQTFLNVQSKYGNLRDNGDLSPKSIKNMRVVLNSALSRAVSAGLLSSNPMAGTIIRSVPSKNVEVMSDESEARLEHYLKSADDHYAAGVLLAMHTGMRLGEVCALRWRDYDPDNCSIRIRETVRRISFYGEESKDRKTGLVFNSPKSEASNRELFCSRFSQGGSGKPAVQILP
jgi:integrase